MSILFQTNSVLTTVQDLGRNGFRRFGVNPTGAMDKQAAILCNLLLGNSENTGVLEMHFPAPAILFEENALIAIGGADFAAEIDNQKIENWRTVFVEKNSTLRFTARKTGARAYLAIKNGFQIEPWLGSQSTNLTARAGGFAGRALRANDRLFFAAQTPIVKPRFNRRIAPDLIGFYSDFPTVRVVVNRDFDGLTVESYRLFQTASFTVGADSNRMGFRLRGEPLELDNAAERSTERLSAAVNFGTIQLLPDKQLIVLMADHQTTGGYPRLGDVAAVDLPIFAQLSGGDRVYFQIISLAAAEELYLERETKLNRLRTASQFL